MDLQSDLIKQSLDYSFELQYDWCTATFGPEGTGWRNTNEYDFEFDHDTYATLFSLRWSQLKTRTP
jgi:hypothetical protein